VFRTGHGNPGRQIALKVLPEAPSPGVDGIGRVSLGGGDCRKSEITDAMKPTWQSMEEEATDEFFGGKCHRPLLTVVSVILVRKLT